MRKILFCIVFLMVWSGLQAQESFTRPTDVRKTLEEDLAPFYHGVASGDPTQTSVILWTRVTPDDFEEDSLMVQWFVATDTAFTDIVQHGEFATFAERDYTVKVEVEGLTPETTYYYAFQTNDITSIAGRTRTAAITADHLRFAVVSCANYQHGYYNSYARVAERNDIDAVIHLGDYIYEYGDDSTEVRTGVEPSYEILELNDYRTRHSFYKLDADLMFLHQQHPIISVWDDHEVANDSWVNGAQNHDPETEGDFQERKSMAHQAYFEWMPIRDNDTYSVYRSISYGNLVDLIMLDTRHHARMAPVDSLTQADYLSPERTILGAEQKEWLKDNLANSTAKWKLIGNQVIFSPFGYQEAYALLPDLAIQLIRDIWEGYPAERNEIIDFLADNDIDNTIILTGDIHATFALDIYSDSTVYDPATGNSSVAVEFVTPSISSNNFDEYIGTFVSVMENLIQDGSENLKALNLTNHGYFVLDVTEEKVQADWFYDPDQTTPSDTESHATSLYTMDETNYLQSSELPSAEKEIQEIPAPILAPIIEVIDTSTTALQMLPTTQVVLLSAQYMTANNSLWLSFSLNEPTDIQIVFSDLSGKVVAEEMLSKEQGLYQLKLPTAVLTQGLYVLTIKDDKGMASKKIMVR